MKQLKIAANAALAGRLITAREIVALSQTDFTDVAAVVVSIEEARSGILSLLHHTGFTIPTFVVPNNDADSPSDILPVGSAWLPLDDAGEHAAMLESAAQAYQDTMLPPFFDTLIKYVDMANTTFACPGHQGAVFP